MNTSKSNPAITPRGDEERGMQTLIRNPLLRTLFVLVWSFFAFSPTVQGQVTALYDKPIADSLRVVSLRDSALRVFNSDSLIEKTMATPDTVMRPGKSTTTALLASMVVPGLGQIYNESYWKAPIVWGLGYYLVSVYKQQNTLYQQYRREYAVSIDSVNLSGDGNLRGLRDFYLKQRDTFAWYIAIAYIVNLLDAYVDASLYNFEVSPNLQPTNGIRATITIHF